jgi:hypothetical protein
VSTKLNRIMLLSSASAAHGSEQMPASQVFVRKRTGKVVFSLARKQA